MTYLIDTDWAADWLAERRAARELLTRLQPAGLFLSLLSYGELYEGIYFGMDPHLMEQRFQDSSRA